MTRNLIIIIMLAFFIVNASEPQSIQTTQDTILLNSSDTALKAVDTAPSVQQPSQAELKPSVQKPGPLDMKTDSANQDTLTAKTNSGIKINKRKYNHREQIVFASVMMLFIAVVIASTDNWNPD